MTCLKFKPNISHIQVHLVLQLHQPIQSPLMKPQLIYFPCVQEVLITKCNKCITHEGSVKKAQGFPICNFTTQITGKIMPKNVTNICYNNQTLKN
jgi:hypothetical protein